MKYKFTKHVSNKMTAIVSQNAKTFSMKNVLVQLSTDDKGFSSISFADSEGKNATCVMIQTDANALFEYLKKELGR